MSNASRQQRYRDKKRRDRVTVKPENVTVSPESVTKSPESATESAPNVTENPVSSEILRKNRISGTKINFNMGEPSATIGARDPWDNGPKTDHEARAETQATVTISTLSDTDLQLRLKSYEGASWVNSPEHKEVLKRRAAQPTGAWT